MRLFGFDVQISRNAAAIRPVDATSPARARDGGWFPIIREPYTGAWQQNAEIRGETALSYFAVYACVTQIVADIGKLRLRLVQQDDDGIWTETSNPAYSPVLRRPNRYQTSTQFVEHWIRSKLVHGNTYVLKERDARGVVSAMYILDASRVLPLCAPDGSVYYELRRDDLAGVTPESDVPIRVPASEIMHDRYATLFHPLIGVTPLYACGLSALQGLTIQQTSTKFFATGSKPGGLLIAPGAITQEQADRLKQKWSEDFTGDKIGRIAVLSDNLKYEPLTVNASDAQLIEQLRFTAETICACYKVPPHKISVGPPPPFATVELIDKQYQSQCLQSLLNAFETVLDEGLGIEGTEYGTEFDIDDLIWLDTPTKTKAAADAIGSGALSPNEVRKKYFGVGPVKGGDTPYLQQQNYSLAALDARDRTNPLTPAPAPPPEPADNDPDGETADDLDGAPPVAASASWTSIAIALLRKDWEGVSRGL